MFQKTLLALTCLMGIQSAWAEKVKETRPTHEVIASAKAEDWRLIPQERLLYLNLDGNRTVVFELAPEFAPKSVEAIQSLAKNQFWDGLEVYRMQDNYVVQFGDANAVHHPDKAKKLPDGHQNPPAEFERPLEGLNVAWLADKDEWSEGVGFMDGFAVAKGEGKVWLTHCYGALGVGRDVAPDSGNGSELYVVTGHAPRYLDRNITLVGRVVYGMTHLSALPRGGMAEGGYAGFYQDPKEYTKVISVKVGTDVPAEQQLALEVMKTDSEVFSAMVETRRNRTGGWFVRQSNYTDVCNIAVPVRKAKS